MSLFIFLISTFCFVTVNAVDICQTEPNDHYISSPDYPKEYPTHLDCILIIPYPQKTLLKLKIIEFSTVTDLDYLNITIGNTTTKLSGKYAKSHEFRFLGIHNVSSITFQFHSESIVINQRIGFNLSYSFIPTEETKTVLNGFHGIINTPYQGNFHKYEITQLTGWYRFVYLYLRHCPMNTTIIVNVDGQASAKLGCLDANSSYYGSNITIEIINQNETPDVLIEYKSVLKKEEEDCHPYFDCGDKFCVPMSTICDGFYDCDNNTDELNCDDIYSRNDSVKDKITMMKERIQMVRTFNIDFERKKDEIEVLNREIISANNQITEEEIELMKFNGSNEQLQEMRNEILKKRNEVTKLLKQKIKMRKEFRIALQDKRKEIEELNIDLKDKQISNIEDKINNDLKLKDDEIATLTKQFAELEEKKQKCSIQTNSKDETIVILGNKIETLENKIQEILNEEKLEKNQEMLNLKNGQKELEKNLGICQDKLRHKNC